MSESRSLRSHAVSGLIWSLVQNWGGKAFGLIIFVLLARLLHPSEFGLASSVFLVLSIMHLVAEFGLGEALVQRKTLEPEDVVLPFVCAMGVSITLSSIIAFFSTDIAAWMGVENGGPYFAASAAICPLMTLSSIQETLYRRELRFRPLALRTLVGALIGGIIGVAMALAGFGTWALIAQFAAATLTSVIWLWLKPVWKPTRAIRPKSALEIARFGLSIFSTYILDMLTLKSVDFIILLSHGPAALGLYTVASRLNLLLLQLLQVSISNVSLAMLSKISDNLPRVQGLYKRSTTFSSLFGMPIFVGLATIAPEVNHLMFGPQWAGADRLMVPLLLIGGLHCVQYLNAAYLTALGQPDVVARLMLYKAFLILPPLYFIHMDSLTSTVDLYVITLLLLTPISFGATLKALGLGWRALLGPLGAPALANALAFCAAFAARHYGTYQPESLVLAALYFGSIFAFAFAFGITIFAFRSAKDTIVFAVDAVSKR